MHPRTAPAMQQIITALAAKHGLDLTRIGAALRLDQPNYDRLCIEVIDTHQVSVAHYFEQHGDLIADPEIVFWTGDGQWTPIAIGQVLTGWREVVQLALDGRCMVTFMRRAQADVASFADVWAANIRDQGWLNVEQPTRIVQGEAPEADAAMVAAA